MKKIVLVFLIYPLLGISQNVIGRKYGDTIPLEYILDVNKLRHAIYDDTPAYYKRGVDQEISIRHAQENAVQIAALMHSGRIYNDWQDLETYLNTILKKILPHELNDDTSIHVYIYREGMDNAFSTASGKILMNVGMLAELDNEASIAAVFAHEVAHYYCKHSISIYTEDAHGGFDVGWFDKTTRPFYKYSIKCETQADSLAAVWLNNSEYSLDGMKSSLEYSHRIQLNEIKSSSATKMARTTHPLTKERILKFNKYLNTNKHNGGKLFLINEKNFFRFRHDARVETVKNLLLNYEYQKCIEKAFRFHLFDPNNTSYIYCLMEAIRRQSYFNNDLWSKLFITNNYYDSIDVDRKKPMSDHLFKKFDFDILPINPNEGYLLKAKHYWKGEPKFTTYESAFNYFYNLSQQLKGNECILSNALSFTQDTSLRNKFLRHYLSFDSIIHREYATCLLKGTITKTLANRKLLVFDKYKISVRYKNSFIPIYQPFDDATNPIIPIYKSVSSEFKNRIPVNLDSLKRNHFAEYQCLYYMKLFTQLDLIDDKKNGKAHLIDPSFWETLHKYNVNEIEFVDCYQNCFYDVKKSMENYIAIASLNYDALFKKHTYGHTLETYVYSVREMDKGTAKILYYSTERSLSNYELTKGIAIQIKSEIKNKDKSSATIDAE